MLTLHSPVDPFSVEGQPPGLPTSFQGAGAILPRFAARPASSMEGQPPGLPASPGRNHEFMICRDFAALEALGTRLRFKVKFKETPGRSPFDVAPFDDAQGLRQGLRRGRLQRGSCLR